MPLASMVCAAAYLASSSLRGPTATMVSPFTATAPSSRMVAGGVHGDDCAAADEQVGLFFLRLRGEEREREIAMREQK